MSILNNLPDEPKKSTIKSSNVKVGNSVCLGEDNSVKDDMIDVTSEDFLSKLTPALQQKIRDTLNLAEQKAQNIISAANAEGEKIKQQAQVQGMEEGKKIGQKEGYQAGYSKVNEDLAKKLQAFDRVIDGIIDSKSEIYRSGEDELLEFVMLLAQKLAHTQIKEDEDAIKNIIIQACSEIREKESLSILVHPDFAQKIYSISDELKTKIYGLKSVKIVEDKSVSDDGVIIESNSSRVDARLSSQVDILMKKLKEAKKEVPILETEKQDNSDNVKS